MSGRIATGACSATTLAAPRRVWISIWACACVGADHSRSAVLVGTVTPTSSWGSRCELAMIPITVNGWPSMKIAG